MWCGTEIMVDTSSSRKKWIIFLMQKYSQKLEPIFWRIVFPGEMMLICKTRFRLGNCSHSGVSRCRFWSGFIAVGSGLDSKPRSVPSYAKWTRGHTWPGTLPGATGAPALSLQGDKQKHEKTQHSRTTSTFPVQKAAAIEI